MAKIENIKTSLIKENERNPRKILVEKYQKLKESIRDFPEMLSLRPLVVDEDNVVLGGNMRLKAIKELGIEEVPIVRADQLTDDQKKRFVVVDNLPFGHWDYDILGADYELGDLEKWGFDIGEMAEDEDDGFNVGSALGSIVIPQTNPGDIYELGGHRLMCGSSTDREAVGKLMGSLSAKMIFTSPPYNMAAKMYANYKDNLKSEEYIKFNLEVIEIYKQFLKGFLFWNISYNRRSRWEFIEIMYRIVKESGLKFLELVVWDKGHGLPIVSNKMLTRQYEDILVAGTEEDTRQDLDLYCLGASDEQAYFNKKTSRGLTNYWKVDTNNSQQDDHFACFPVGLPLKAIRLMSDVGDLVVDPFSGAGSTLIACVESKRRFCGMELDPRYVDLTVTRYCTMMGTEKIIKNGQETIWTKN